MILVFTTLLADLKEKLISQTDITQAENQEPWVLSNDEVYHFNWPDLYYYLSLNGLHNSAPFQSQYPEDSIYYEKYYYVQDYGIFALTKTSF